MANIQWTSQANGPRAVVQGIIGGETDLAVLARPPDPRAPLTIDVGGIRAFTSTGVHAWLELMRAFRDAGRSLVFVRCSRAVVRQHMWIEDFLVGGVVRSVLAPYLCASCDAEIEIEVPAVEPIVFVAPTRPCACGAAMELDDEAMPYDSLLREAVGRS
jgi:hypothetical protein